MSLRQKKSRMRNYAKMRIAGATSIRKMLTQKKYVGVLRAGEMVGIEGACDLLDAVLDTWDRRR